MGIDQKSFNKGCIPLFRIKTQQVAKKNQVPSSTSNIIALQYLLLNKVLRTAVSLGLGVSNRLVKMKNGLRRIVVNH